MKLTDFDAEADRLIQSTEARKDFWWGVAFCAVLAFVFMLIAFVAFAHGDAAWIASGDYRAANEAHCCGDADCHRITDESAVKRTAEGWEYAGVFFPDTQHGHGLYATEREDPFFCEWGGKVRCLFVIPEGA